MLVLSAELTKKIFGRGTPNMYNPQDWPVIFQLYLNGLITYSTNPINNTYPTFIITDNGFLRGNHVSPLSVPGDTPKNNGHTSDTFPTPVSDTGIYGNKDGVKGNDGFYVPFFAFVRFVIGYYQAPASQKAQYLANGSYNMNQLRFGSITNPTDFKFVYNWLVDHPQLVKLFFKNSFPPLRRVTSSAVETGLEYGDDDLIYFFDDDDGGDDDYSGDDGSGGGIGGGGKSGGNGGQNNGGTLPGMTDPANYDPNSPSFNPGGGGGGNWGAGPPSL